MSNELITPAAMFLHKKNAARKILAQKGTLKREGSNTFDNYTYFSEAQYKKLFTEIFSEVGLEMTCDETSIVDIQGTDKQRFGRRVTLKFTLSDIDTGYSEVSHSTGEGFDKGDKAIYKAKTGALKYWLADEWMVATGDDPETESPSDSDAKAQPQRRKAQARKTGDQPTITPAQINIVQQLYKPEEISQMLNSMGLTELQQVSVKDASKMIAYRRKAA